jgi:uncharacterized protein YuzE
VERKLSVDYYEEGDELNVLVGGPSECQYVEVGDDVYVRLDPETREVTGFTIVNFLAGTRNRRRSVPVRGEFSLPPRVLARLAAA